MSIYLNMRALNGASFYNIKLLIGARGRGKTYACKKYAINKAIKDGAAFIWLRNTEEMTKELKRDKGRALTKDLKDNGDMPQGYDITIDGDGTIQLEHDGDRTPCGYLLALSTWYKLKGNSFSNIKNIIFDEFIPESNEVIRGDRARQFINFVETVCRLRQDVSIFCTANALDLADPVLNLFFKDVKTFGIYKNKAKRALLWYIGDSPKFDAERFKSVSGRILKGTAYEANIAGNVFQSSDGLYFDRKPKGLSPLFNIEIQPYRISMHTDGVKFFALIKEARGLPCFVRDVESKTDKATTAPPTLRDRLKSLYVADCVLFENEHARRVFVDFIK